MRNGRKLDENVESAGYRKKVIGTEGGCQANRAEKRRTG